MRAGTRQLILAVRTLARRVAPVSPYQRANTFVPVHQSALVTCASEVSNLSSLLLEYDLGVIFTVPVYADIQSVVCSNKLCNDKRRIESARF